VWDGDQIYFCLEQAGATPLYKVPADGNGKPERITDGDSTVTGFDVRREVIAETRTTATVPAELFVDDRRVSHVTSNFTSLAEVQEPERYIATSKDGSEVECWILRPPGFDKHARYPVLLNVHGGPFAQYGYRFHDEFSVYAGAGYVVVYCNPRGSSGYSQEWGRAIRGPSNDQGPGLGTVDADDVMACIETALKRFDFCDPRRLGVMGGSYGGYMTSWLVGHTDIFQAALSERAVNNWISFFGSSDNGHVFKGEIGSWPSEDVEGYLKISPTTYADAINTPLMIMHSENDLRCDIEQAQYLFTLLRLQRKEVEFVRFPAESHELTRSGSPHHRVQRFEIILDWFGKHLTE
jgi:dipeptidyl aminopeptidase/acylaminoacyl peptidase